MRGAVLYGQRDVRFEERAVPTMAMTHIAIQEQLDGKTVDWMEQESPQQYRKSGGFGHDCCGSEHLWKQHRRG
jgi:hypothetical protein